MILFKIKIIREDGKYRKGTISKKNKGIKCFDNKFQLDILRFIEFFLSFGIFYFIIRICVGKNEM